VHFFEEPSLFVDLYFRIIKNVGITTFLSRYLEIGRQSMFVKKKHKYCYDIRNLNFLHTVLQQLTRLLF
jgi:hypothetical protein